MVDLRIFIAAAFVSWSLLINNVSAGRNGAITIKSVAVESLGPNKAAKASVVVRTTKEMPVYVYWSDVTTWFPAEGHPNYTISEKAWIDDEYIMLQSTIEIKKVLLEQLSYYYDYDKEHLVYYLPMTADIRSGDGQFIYHQAFDIPEKQSSQNYSQARFRLIDKPDELISYSVGDEVELRWRFLSRDENEFTLWRTIMKGPNEIHDLDYADEILYAEDVANTYPDKIKKFNHINVTKSVHYVGRLYLVTVSVKMNPVNLGDEGLYVLFLKSRKSLSWDKALNLRLSTRLLHANATTLLGNKVALALSFCDGSDVRVEDGVAYFGMKPGVENCIKCESYGNFARDLVLTKDRYLIHPSINNAVVHSRYYPETKSISYTFRNESKNDRGTYFCRAVLKNNDVVSRAFDVAWTKDLSLEAKIIYVNQTRAMIECKTTAVPKPELSLWRCDGNVYCSLQRVETGPNYDIVKAEDSTSGLITVRVALRMSAAELKKEAIMCRSSNKFDLQEDWLLFDDQITIEEAQPEDFPAHMPLDINSPTVQNGVDASGDAKRADADVRNNKDVENIQNMPQQPSSDTAGVGAGFNTDSGAGSDTEKPYQKPYQYMSGKNPAEYSPTARGFESSKDRHYHSQPITYESGVQGSSYNKQPTARELQLDEEGSGGDGDGEMVTI